MQSDFNDYNFKQIERNLYKEYIKLRYRLIDLFEEWYLMNSSVRSRLMLNYQRHFGELEVELIKKRKEAESIKSVIDSISDDKLNLKTNKFNNSNVDNIDNTIPFNNLNNQYDLSKTYKSIVKLIHPDVNEHYNENSKLWDIVQLAYKKEDYKKLKSIHELIINEEKSDYNNIKSKVRKLKNQIQLEEFKLEKMKSIEPFSYEFSLKDESWINNRKNEIKNEINRFERKINFRKKILDSLKGENRFLRHKSKIN